MDVSDIKQQLQESGIELSDWQAKKVQTIIDSGKIDLRIIEKLLLPELPEHLLNDSLDVISHLEIGL